MGEGEGSGGGDGGARGVLSPVGGSKGPEPLASPNVIHWVGWLPGTTRCAAGPAVPASHGAVARRARGVQVKGRLAETELRLRPRAARSSGSLSGPAIPVSPQAARPAVSERGIGAGGVSGCSAMPGSEKVQPARQSSRIQEGQDTVEHHAGLDPVMEKINQSEPERPTSNGREMIDDFRLRGSRTCRGMDAPLRNEGWRVGVAHEVARPFNNPNAPLSEGEVLAVVVQVVPGNPHWTRVGKDCPNPMG